MALGFTVFLALGVSPAHAQMLVVETSDNHSAYHNLPTFLRSFDAAKREFESRHPGAPIVVVINGDFAGLSEWSDKDYGWLGIQALATLTKVAHVVYVLGNHDGFDLGVIGRGNITTDRQMKFLYENGVHILGSNINFTERSKRWVKPHFDVVSASGRKTRFVGYGLEELEYKSDFDLKVKYPKVIHKIGELVRDTLTEMSADFVTATTAGIDDLILFQHDAYPQVEKKVTQLKDSLSPNAKPAIPVAFAGHDHKKYSGRVGETVIVDSGSNYEYSIVELDADGKVTRHNQMDLLRQSVLTPKKAKHPRLEEFAEAAEKWLIRESVKMNHVVGETNGYFETKLVNKTGPTLLGTHLAETLATWGEKQIAALKLPNHPVVALYNTSSYRRDEPVPAGELTVKMYKSFYPLPGEAKVFPATGAEIQEIFRAIRVWRETQADGSYTPQISEDLKEGDAKQLFFRGQPIEAEKMYYLALDPWLSRNGNKLPIIYQFLANRQPVAKSRLLNIFIEHGADVLTGSQPAPIQPKQICRAFGNAS